MKFGLIWLFLTNSVVIGPLIYAGFFLACRRWFGLGRVAATDVFSYEILARRGQQIAVRTDRAMNHAIGLVVAGAPLPSMLVTGWRYGISRGVWLGVTPFLIWFAAMVAPNVIQAIGEPTPGAQNTDFSMWPLRLSAVAIGLAIARFDARLRTDCLYARGWLRLGAVSAMSPTAALQQYRQTA